MRDITSSGNFGETPLVLLLLLPPRSANVMVVDVELLTNSNMFLAALESRNSTNCSKTPIGANSAPHRTKRLGFIVILDDDILATFCSARTTFSREGMMMKSMALPRECYFLLDSG